MRCSHVPNPDSPRKLFRERLLGDIFRFVMIAEKPERHAVGLFHVPPHEHGIRALVAISYFFEELLLIGTGHA